MLEKQSNLSPLGSLLTFGMYLYSDCHNGKPMGRAHIIVELNIAYTRVIQ